MSKKSKFKPWIKKYCTPLKACQPALLEANKYLNLQAAWWTSKDPDQLLWLLLEIGVDGKEVLDYFVKTAERAVPIYEESYPDDTRIRDAVETLRQYSKRV